MAPGQHATDFNIMINTNRQRRKNEALAKEIFTKGRRSSAPGSGMNNRKPGTGPSLASRIGVAKQRNVSSSIKPGRENVRTSAGNVNAEWTHDLHPLDNSPASRTSQAPPRGPKASRATNRNNRLYSVLNSSASSPALKNQFNIVGSSKPMPGISIRGIAGPYVVVAKNFAPGTTVADIESAMTPIGGVVVSCLITAEIPKVVAELIFETKRGADNVVDTFNNQNADGNILHVYLKNGPASSGHNLLNTQGVHSSPPVRSVTPLGPRVGTDRSDDTVSGRGGSDKIRYTARERSREHRRDYNKDDVMDGSYGFEDSMETDDLDNSRQDKVRDQGLYSDNLIGNRGRGNYTSRDRGRGNDRARVYR